MTQPGRPAAIAGNGVDRGRQCCNRVGIKARAIDPRTAAPSGLAGRRQREQGGIVTDLTDDVMAEAQRGTDQRAAHVPGVEQQADWVTDRAQQSLGHSELAGVAQAAAQAADQRHRAIPARDDSGQRDEALAQQERRALAAWSKRTAAPGASTEQRGASVSSITTKQRPAPISRRTIRHSAPIRPSSRNRSSIQCASRAGASAPGTPA